MTGDFPIVSKDDGTNREWVFDFNENGASDEIRFTIFDSGGGTNYSEFTALTGGDLLLGELQHLVFTWDGTTGKLYQDGQSLTTTKTDFGSGFSDFSNTSSPVRVGKSGTASFFIGEINDVRVYNFPMTLAQVVRSGSDNTPYSEQWAGINGAKYTSDFSAGVDSFSGTFITLAGNIDNVALVDDTLRGTISPLSAGDHPFFRLNFLDVGRTYILEYDFYIPSGNSHLDGLRATFSSGGSSNIITQDDSPSLDTWTHAYGVGVTTSDDLYFYPQDGGDVNINDTGGDDLIYIKNIQITEAGSIAEIRSSNFDKSTGKLYDLSGNNFTGTNTGAILIGRETPIYKTGTWTPGLTFGGGSTGMTFSDQEGNYTRTGNIVYLSGYFTLTAKGSSTGSALLTGLPFTAVNLGAQTESFVFNSAGNMASLTSVPTGTVNDNATTVSFNHWGAAGTSALTEANFTDTTTVKFSGTIQIQ